MEKIHPVTNRGQGVNVDSLQQSLIKDAPRRLAMLMGAVILVLLIACANVANLLTSRALVRRREVAVRSALGAGVARIARQQLCESMLLALTGGAMGLALAYVATVPISHFAAGSLPRIEEVSVDRSVLLFTFGVSLLTEVVFGVFPALMALRVDPNEVLKDATYSSRSGLTCMGTRGFLAVAELALSLVLLVATGLTVKSLFHLVQIDLGFQSSGVLTGSLSLPSSRYASPAQRAQFIENLTAKVAELPGVKAAGFASPLLGGSQTDFRVEGRPVPQPEKESYVEIDKVTPGVLESLSVRLLGGRFFHLGDDRNASLVCIIDEALAEQYWPRESALGKRFNFDFVSSIGLQHSWWTVVRGGASPEVLWGKQPVVAGSLHPPPASASVYGKPGDPVDYKHNHSGVDGS